MKLSSFAFDFLLGRLDLLLQVRVEIAEKRPEPMGIDQVMALGKRFATIKDKQCDLGCPSNRVAFGQSLDQLFVVG